MKKIFFLFIVVGALAALAPKFIGNYAEQQYRLLLGRADQTLIKVSNVSYERGWFRSRAVTAIALRFPGSRQLQNQKSSAPLHFEMVHDIIHGPVIWSGKKIQFGLMAAVTHLRMTGKSKEMVHRIFGEKEPLTIETLRTFSGPYQLRLITAGAAYRNPEKGIAFTLQPAGGEWQMSGDLATSKGTLRWPGMRFTADKGQLHIEDVSYVFDLREFNEFLWLGTNTFRAGRIGFRASGQPDIQFTDLQVAADADGKEGLLQVREDIALAKLTAGGASYGPDALSMRLHHLDLAAVTELAARQRESVARMCSSATPEAAKAINDEFAQAFLSLLPKLLQKGPEFEISNLSLSLPAGKVTGRAKVVVDASHPELLAQLATLPKTLDANFRLDVPRAILAGTKLELQADVLLAKGYLKESQGTISLLGQYAQGRLTLNGQSFPPSPATAQ
ncbi:MAG: YdgA family protein [Deltaproteobacteria bacterium]